MTSKHTPGPLYARVIRRVKGDYAEVRTVNPLGIGQHIARFDCGDAGMDKANAELFAEAHVMLEALRRFARVTPGSDPVIMFALIEQTKAILGRIDGGK